jgi:hypothetical protein
VLSRFWLEFDVWRDLQHGAISRRFGLNIFDTGQFSGYIGSASITLTLWRAFRGDDRNQMLALAARLPVHAPLTGGGTH